MSIKTKLNADLNTDKGINISIVLVRPGNPGNIGAVARAMANFGFDKLILVSPKCKIDEEAHNRAKHAQKILSDAKIVKNFKDVMLSHGICVATTGVLGTDYNIPRSPLLIEAAARKITRIKKGNVAIVFGPEDTGLSNEELEACDFTATIPTSKAYSVMNLSHSVALFLYELSKAKGSNVLQIKKNYPLIEGREKEELEKTMARAISSVKYRTVFEKRTQILVWKRVIGKAMPTRREAFAMIGFLKKVADKNNSKNKK
jgi:tRNA/rRNA methyltransferase